MAVVCSSKKTRGGWITDYGVKVKLPPCMTKWHAMKTYSGVEVQLHTFYCLQKESRYSKCRPYGPRTLFIHHSYAAQEGFVCNVKLGDLNIFVCGNYVKCYWKCVHHFLWNCTFIMCLKSTEDLYLCSGGVTVFMLTLQCLKLGIPVVQCGAQNA